MSLEMLGNHVVRSILLGLVNKHMSSDLDDERLGLVRKN